MIALTFLVRNVAGAWSSPSQIAAPSTSQAGLDFPWEYQGFFANGNHWVFYSTTGSCESHTSNCISYACSPDGSTWTITATALFSGNREFSAYARGTTAYYLRADGTEHGANQALLFDKGTLPSTCGAITFGSEQTVKAASATDSWDYPSLVVDANLQVETFYYDYVIAGGNGTPFFIHSTGTNYAAWTGNSQLNTTAITNWRGMVSWLTSGAAYVSWWNSDGTAANQDLYGESWNLTGGGALGSVEKIAPLGAQADLVTDEAFVLGDGTTNKVYAFYHCSSNACSATTKLRYNTRDPSSNAWGTPTTIIVPPITSGNQRFSVTWDSQEMIWHLFYYDYNNNVINEYTLQNSVWSGGQIFTTASAGSGYVIGSYSTVGITSGPATAIFGLWWTQDATVHLDFSTQSIVCTLNCPGGGGPSGGGGPGPTGPAATPAGGCVIGTASCNPALSTFSFQTLLVCPTGNGTLSIGCYPIPVQLTNPAVPQVIVAVVIIALSSTFFYQRNPAQARVIVRKIKRDKRRSLV